MNHELAKAIGRALEETRAGNPGMATRIIQSALRDKARPPLAKRRSGPWLQAGQRQLAGESVPPLAG